MGEVNIGCKGVAERMKVLLLPSLSCNLKCEYCYLNSKKTSGVIDEMRTYHTRVLSPSFYMKSLDWLYEEYGEPIESVDVSGGEPFLYSGMVELADRIRTKYGSISITSNLEKIPDEFFKLKPNGIFITASAHLEDGKIRQGFIEKLKALKDNGFHFGLNFVAYPKQILSFEKCKNIAKQFGTYCHLEPYVNYNSEKTAFGEFENEDDKRYFEDNITMPDATGMGLAKERGTNEILCGVAREYVVISENGNVWPCLGMMFERRNMMANIFKKETYLKKKDVVPLKCDIFCPCAQNYRDGIR